MQESVAGLLSGVLAGSSFVFHAAGWLEGGLTFGFEKFVMDLDRCGMVQRLLGGLVVDEESLAAEAYREAGPGGNFLGTAHTLARCESASYLSGLADTNSCECRTENGRLDLERRAHGTWKRMLANYEVPPLDPAVDEALPHYVARRKATLPERRH